MNYELKQARERGCQCGDDEACQFVRERDAAREQVARLEACGPLLGEEDLESGVHEMLAIVRAAIAKARGAR